MPVPKCGPRGRLRSETRVSRCRESGSPSKTVFVLCFIKSPSSVFKLCSQCAKLNNSVTDDKFKFADSFVRLCEFKSPIIRMWQLSEIGVKASRSRASVQGNVSGETYALSAGQRATAN